MLKNIFFLGACGAGMLLAALVLFNAFHMQGSDSVLRLLAGAAIFSLSYMGLKKRLRAKRPRNSLPVSPQEAAFRAAQARRAQPTPTLKTASGRRPRHR